MVTGSGLPFNISRPRGGRRLRSLRGRRGRKQKKGADVHASFAPFIPSRANERTQKTFLFGKRELGKEKEKKKRRHWASFLTIHGPKLSEGLRALEDLTEGKALSLSSEKSEKDRLPFPCHEQGGKKGESVKTRPTPLFAAWRPGRLGFWRTGKGRERRERGSNRRAGPSFLLLLMTDWGGKELPGAVLTMDL